MTSMRSASEANVSKIKGAVSHHESELAELKVDRELAVEYLKATMESLDNPDDRAAGFAGLTHGGRSLRRSGGGGRRSGYQSGALMNQHLTNLQKNMSNATLDAANVKIMALLREVRS